MTRTHVSVNSISENRKRSCLLALQSLSCFTEYSLEINHREPFHYKHLQYMYADFE